MIPRVIHYCWFGHNAKPKLTERCVASWKKYCPDYEIIEWNEDNFDLGRHPYLGWCSQQGKWAFLSDYARLLILREHGGIYLDADVEIIRPLDPLLEYDAFFGFETEQYVNTGIGCGSVPHHPAIDSMLAYYEALEPGDDGSYPLKACPRINTEALVRLGLTPNGERQQAGGAEILPPDWFNPFDDPTGRLRITENTYSIHWYQKSWIGRKSVFRSRLMRPLHRVFGTEAFRRFRKKR